MPKPTTPDPGNDRPTPTVTREEVQNWERDLAEALRDARHHIDHGTGSVMDHEDPPPMWEDKLEAHGAITDAEEFIEKIAGALKDFICACERARRNAPTDRASEPSERAAVAGLADELRNVEAASARIRELFAKLAGSANFADDPKRPV